MPVLRRWEDVGGAIVAQTICPGVLRLHESAVAPAERSYFYLVEGRDRDCLIDGGWGFGGNLDALRRDPHRPMVAVATHSHFDHIGHLHRARFVLAHAAEAQFLENPDPVAVQALPYLDGLVALADGDCIDPATICFAPCADVHDLAEGDAVDLGGTVLKVLHTPGHSPGSLSLLDEARGLLFCADTLHDGHIWDDIPGADRTQLLLSHQRLAGVDFLQACPGHGAILDREQALARMPRYRAERGHR